MTRTRGASSQYEGRRRPTASVRRGDHSASSSAPAGGADSPNADAPDARDVPVGFPGAGDVVGYPRGPSDVSLLVNYNHHVALRLWQGAVRIYYLYFLFLCYFSYIKFLISFVLFWLGSGSPKSGLLWKKG